jgi:hypothetical protein
VLLFFGEFPFLRRLVLRQNPCTRFPSSLPNAWNFAKVGWNDEREIHCTTFSILWHLYSQFWQVMDVERRNQHFCFDYSFLNPKLGWHTPKLFDELNHEPKDENIERRRNWGTFLGSQHFKSKRACWSSRMGIRMIDKQVNYSHRLTQTKQQVG